METAQAMPLVTVWSYLRTSSICTPFQTPWVANLGGCSIYITLSRMQWRNTFLISVWEKANDELHLARKVSGLNPSWLQVKICLGSQHYDLKCIIWLLPVPSKRANDPFWFSFTLYTHQQQIACFPREREQDAMSHSALEPLFPQWYLPTLA